MNRPMKMKCSFGIALVLAALASVMTACSSNAMSSPAGESVYLVGISGVS